MILRLDGTDYSHLVPRHGYTVSYKKILGSNSVYTLDGTYHEDVLAFKAICSIELKPMTPDVLAQLVQSVENCDTATFYSTRDKADITVKVGATLSPSTLVLNAPERQYWSTSESQGMTLTLEER